VEERLPARDQLATEYTWNTHSVFASHNEWEGEFEDIAGSLAELAEFRGTLAKGPSQLADCLEALEAIFERMGKVCVYAGNFHNADTTDQAAMARNDRAMGLRAQLAATCAFVEPELIAIGFETLRAWLAEEPRLSHYQHFVDNLQRRQEHVRSDEVESVLSAAMDPFGSASAIHGVLADADLTFAPARASSRPGVEIQVAQGTLDALHMSEDRQTRRTAWESYSDAHLGVQNTMAACLATGVKQHVFMARVRGYDSALHASLDRNSIPVQVYHNVTETFRKNLPIWHRYWRLRRQALGCETLRAYDVKAPLTETKPQVPLAQSVEWLTRGLAPLGEEYVSIARRGLLEERWVDIYPNKGKRAGAYSDGAPGTYPFILMSYTDDLESLSTLAHEMGHSMHSYYTWKTQPYVYSDYSIFVAEVPSNLNQALTRHYLLETHDDPAFQIAVIEEAMSNFHRYLFLMPTLARFELEIHERIERGEALTAQSMNALVADLFEEAYGGEVEMDRDRVGITWAQFPTHLYADFYVYQYTIGIAAAHVLAGAILSGQPGALERYLRFLRTGSSLYPVDALREAGVDLTSIKPIQGAFDYLAGLVDRLEVLL